MKQLIHNGILVPKYEWKRFRITVKGTKLELTPEQEEMAVAWVRKLGTPYVEDKVFAKNFFRDFCKALNMKGNLGPEDFDFSMIRENVEREKTLKLGLSKETKKQIAVQRKAMREANKEECGYAVIDGVKTEISNYIAEPSCIFMGRGKHPLRGSWKAGPREEDIELNFFNSSPDAPRPSGNWKGIIWQPDALWIARWNDKLTGKVKYVWLSDTSILKQKKDNEKFNKAQDLRQNLALIQKHILENLDADDLRRRKTATVCFLIDKLKIRVGDEKDPDEADTVGASTLRPEHIRFDEDGKVVFNFLGKDSVPHIFNVELPEKAVRNLKELSACAKSTLFDGVDSNRVSDFLGEVASGLSAKVFRTCYASQAVEGRLKDTPLTTEAPDYVKKYAAAMANLEAAKLCNHKRAIPKTWESSLQKKENSLRARIEKAKDEQEKLKRKAKETPEQRQKLKEQLEKMRQRDETAIEQMRLQIDAKKKTRDYNLTTSLKSYIDPRIYYDWGKKVNYDWKLYYPKTLQKKFSWIEPATPSS
jgi:DNA topoisomerase-1